MTVQGNTLGEHIADLHIKKNKLLAQLDALDLELAHTAQLQTVLKAVKSHPTAVEQWKSSQNPDTFSTKIDSF